MYLVYSHGKQILVYLFIVEDVVLEPLEYNMPLQKTLFF